MKLQNTADLKLIAHNTEHYTGADLKAVLYSAQLRAAHRLLDKEKQEVMGVASSSSTTMMSSTTTMTSSEDTVTIRGSREAAASSDVMVYRLTSSGRCTEQQAKPDLHQKVYSDRSKHTSIHYLSGICNNLFRR